MKRYFNNCHTAEELKQTYRELVKKMHPDNGGDAELFKDMQQEFSRVFGILKDMHTNKDGKTYQSSTESQETAADFMDIIEKLSHMPGVIVDLCGTWLWISGNTYQNREALKSAGCKYAPKKGMWSWHVERVGEHYRKGGSEFSQIVSKYGIRHVCSGRQDVLTN